MIPKLSIEEVEKNYFIPNYLKQIDKAQKNSASFIDKNLN